MNDNFEPLDADGESLVDELLSRLKEIEPTLETRLHNRLAVAEELKRLHAENRNRALPWWRRSLSVPLPLAAAALVLLVALAALWGLRPAPTDRNLPLAAPAQPTPPVPRDPALAAAPRLERVQENEHYVYGFGWLKSELTYRNQE